MNGAATTATFNIEVVTSLGIGGVTVDSQVTVEPNPVVETLYVTCGFNSDAATFVIYDQAGKMVYNSTEAVSAGSAKAINMTTFANGVYILKVAAKEGAGVQRIIKK